MSSFTFPSAAEITATRERGIAEAREKYEMSVMKALHKGFGKGKTAVEIYDPVSDVTEASQWWPAIAEILREKGFLTRTTTRDFGPRDGGSCTVHVVSLPLYA